VAEVSDDDDVPLVSYVEEPHVEQRCEPVAAPVRRSGWRRASFAALAFATLVVVTCAVFSVVLLRSIQLDERRQTCVARWSAPFNIQPNASQEARTAWYVAALRCVGVTP
jgi:hypothetical protein